MTRHIHASALHRIMYCRGSVAMVDGAPSQPQDDDAKEGDAAHWLAHQMLMDRETDNLKEAANGWAIDAEMRAHAANYAARIHTRITSEDSLGGYEANAHWDVPDSEVSVRCRVDAWRNTNRRMTVSDFKYGWRLVSPLENWQLIAGAVGLAVNYGSADEYVLEIHQPRPYHPEGEVRSTTITHDGLVAYYNQICAQLRQLDDQLQTGGYCGHCPGAQLGLCRAYAEASLNAVDVASRGSPLELTDAALAAELRTMRRAKEIVTQREGFLKDLAVQRMADNKIVPGFAMEPQFGNRNWTDWDAARAATNVDLTAAPKPCTPAEAKRRGMSDDQLAQLTERKLSGYKLIERDADAYVRSKLGD